MGNAIWPHSPLVLSHLLTNAYLKYIRSDENLSITPRIEPINLYSKEKQEVTKMGEHLVILILFVIYAGMAFSISTSSIGYHLIKEWKASEKFMQITNGLNITECWIGRFLADFSTVLIPITAIIIFKARIVVDVIFNITLAAIF